MTSQTFVLLSGALSFGLPMLIAVRELLTLPGLTGSGDDPRPEAPVIPVPKPLPACLLPKATPVRELARVPVREVA